ncbi:MAG TPA: ABC transporter permease [Baekduia sp.]|uniref:ABC transporter permease n=1 Tax=Baekduia sp. TaxID=2600305 RepID=UPI002D786973|nr:ABC transporter permease [Baekduia sp.]HET6505386.1 ABC transporter permease [Baekduia sp.]
MSAATADTAAAPRERGRGRVTQRHVIRSEWTKLWSLRSTRSSLLSAVIAMTGLGILIAVIQMNRWARLDPLERARFDSRNIGVGGYHLAQLAIGVLGVLIISGEYSTGMIRSSFMAVPHRLPVLWAKLCVFCSVTFATMLASTFVSFFVTQVIVRQHHQQHALSDPHALRVVIGAALYLTVLGALCVGLGTLVRSTAGGIAAFVFLLFVLPGITAILPHTTADAIDPYLPLNAGTAVATSTFEPGPHLAPWTGFALFCGYAVAAIAAAAVGLVRRDA